MEQHAKSVGDEARIWAVGQEKAKAEMAHAEGPVHMLFFHQPFHKPSCRSHL